MKKLEELYEKLKMYSDFDHGDNCENFLNTIDEIVLIGNSESIKEILRFFDDNSEYSWVFESTRKLIEHFSDYSYTTEIVRFIKNKDILLKNINWMVCFLYSIMNAQSCLDIMKKNIKFANQEALFQILDLIEKESPERSELINELKEERKKFPH